MTDPTSLVLTPATDPAAGGPLAISLSGITPDRLAGLALDAVRRLAVTADERPAQLGELFSISGDTAGSVVECQGDFSRVHFVGAGMAGGTVRVAGRVGRHAAEGMTGGRLEVAGDAGDWLAAEMSGGEVVIGGSAGDNLAGSLPGSDHGLRGGMVVVAGDAGCLAGQRMRRGIVAVGGDCGPAAAFEMRAGTVLVAGRVGPWPGLGMRRGSLVALADQPAIPATFQRGRAWLPPFIGLQLTELRRAGYRPPLPPPARFRQWHGDLIAGGRGEILAPEPS
jgi:formylmethanofuran dehydrogenase subunit C